MTKENLRIGFSTVFGIAMAFMILMQTVTVISLYSTIGWFGIPIIGLTIYLYLKIINTVGEMRKGK